MSWRIPLLGVFLDDLNLSDSQRLKSPAMVFSLNLEQTVLIHENQELRRAFEAADYVLADGEAVVIALNTLFSSAYKKAEFRQDALERPLKKISKQAGCDLAKKMITEKNRIAILGSSEEVLEQIKKNFGKKIVFAHHGFFSVDNSDEIAKKIEASQPDLLLVGMGAPRQEIFLHQQKKYFSSCISLAVGGSLDLLAGESSRAPRLWIDLKLEWLWRIFQEPFRIKRIISRVPKFFFLILGRLFSDVRD